MRARVLPVLVTLAATALAGCLAEPLGPSGLPGPAEVLQELPAYGYVCPGEEGAAQPAPCLRAIARDDATEQEPYAAVHPTDPGIMAIGVNFGPPLLERLQGLPEGQSHICKLGIYLTEDGGATWRETFAPPPPFETGPLGPTPTQCAGDPALVFDAQGRLHVTGIATAGTLPPELPQLAGDGLGFVTYYVRSDDLGATWGTPVVVSQNGSPQDRNWMLLDRDSGILYVDWQNTGGDFTTWTTEVAWSLDGGDSWQNQAPEARAVCHTPGPPVRLGQEVLFSCANTTAEEETRVRVYAFDPATGASTLRSDIVQQGFWPVLTAFEDERLAVQYGTFDGDTQVLWSRDGGRTWGNPTSLRGLSEGSWAFADAMWSESDALGAYHLVVRLSNPGLLNGVINSRDWELRHLILDAEGQKAQEVTLAAWSTPEPGTPRPAQTLGDHYYGIAPGPAGVLLAFTRDAAVQLTLAVPEPASAP